MPWPPLYESPFRMTVNLSRLLASPRFRLQSEQRRQRQTRKTKPSDAEQLASRNAFTIRSGTVIELEHGRASLRKVL